MGFNFSATSRSNARGEFLLEGIHQGAEVMLEAEAGEVRTGAPQPGVPDAPDPIRLVISGANTVSLEGKVVDSAGSRSPEAVVEIRSRPLGKDAGPDPDRSDSPRARSGPIAGDTSRRLGSSSAGSATAPRSSPTTRA